MTTKHHQQNEEEERVAEFYQALDKEQYLAAPDSEPNETHKPTPHSKNESWRNLVAFFICGLLNNYSYVVMLSAAHHILPNYVGLVLLADILPGLILKLVAPFWFHLIPFNIRVILIALFAVISFQSVAWLPNAYLKLIGVCFASLSSGAGEITFLAMTSYYHKNTVSAWGSGTGGAGVFGALSYLAITSWFNLSNTITLNIITVLPPFILVSVFIIMTGNHSKNGFFKRPVPVDKKANIYALTFVQKLKFIPNLLKYMIPLWLVYYSEYVINQGVSPTLRFTRSYPIDPNDCYTYYQFLYQSGVFVSRSSVNFFPIKRIWIPCVLQFVNLVLLLIDAYYRIIPVIWFVFAIIFYEGLLGGAAYVNAFYRITVEVPPEYKEFSLSIVSLADTMGIAMSGLTSVFLQPWLKANQKRRPI